MEISYCVGVHEINHSLLDFARFNSINIILILVKLRVHDLLICKTKRGVSANAEDDRALNLEEMIHRVPALPMPFYLHTLFNRYHSQSLGSHLQGHQNCNPCFLILQSGRIQFHNSQQDQHHFL